MKPVFALLLLAALCANIAIPFVEQVCGCVLLDIEAVEKDADGEQKAEQESDDEVFFPDAYHNGAIFAISATPALTRKDQHHLTERLVSENHACLPEFPPEI